MTYFAPQFEAEAFHCPLCNVYAHMYWYRLGAGGYGHTDMHAARCSKCNDLSFWYQESQEETLQGVMVYPSASLAPLPSPDLPKACFTDFNEARTIVGHSPRGAAALLRLAIQKLCIELGMPGKNINDDIKTLVRDRNLSEMVQQALDAIRVIGNNAVHPGELQLEDDEGTALTLFDLINIIVDEMITKPNKAKALFDRLPEGAKAAIAKRDQA